MGYDTQQIQTAHERLCIAALPVDAEGWPIILGAEYWLADTNGEVYEYRMNHLNAKDNGPPTKFNRDLKRSFLTEAAARQFLEREAKR
jgi:hypothetical protein